METAVLERSPEVATLDILEAQLIDARRAQARVDDKRLHSSQKQETEVERLTREAYIQAQTAYGTELLADQLQAAESEAERNSFVAQYLIDEFRALQEERETPANQDILQRAKRLGRSALRATGAWLSKGNRGTQIVKGALVTGAASVLFGALGGGIAAAGGMAAVRYGKAYASGVSQGVETHHSSAAELTEALNTHEYETVHAIFEHAQAVLHREREAHIDATQERNTKARKQALGAMVVGAVIGTTAGSLIHYGSDVWPTVAHAQEIGGTHVTTGLVDSTHETTGTVMLPQHSTGDVTGFHATTGGVDTISHESTGTVVIQEHEADGTVEGATATQSSEATGFVSGVHETSGEVGLPESIFIDNPDIHTTIDGAEGVYETTGMVAGVHETTGTIEGVHETAGTVDGVEAGTPETPEALVDRGVFTVEAGNGLIRENIQWAAASGYDVPNSVMEQLHYAEVEQFGAKDIIDLQNYEQDTYMHGTDVRINAPGEAVWRDKVVDFKVKWLADHGYYPDGTVVDVDSTHVDIETAESSDSGVVDAESETDKSSDTTVVEDEPVFSAEDWTKIEGLLEKAADRDMLGDLAVYDQTLMDGIGPRLETINYPDGSPVVSYSGGHWTFNDSVYSLPEDALSRIHGYLDEHDAVAERVQRLTRML